MPALQAPKEKADMASPPEVILVEDDPEQLGNLEDLLALFGLSTVSYRSVQAVLTQLPPQTTGCLVLDLRLEDGSGLDLLEALRQRGQWLPAVIVSGQATVPETVRALELGVHGFFLKPVEPPALVHAVHTALADEVQWRQVQLCQQRLAVLSARERQVLQGLMADKPVRQIARELGISVSTVEKHRAKIMSKVGVDSVIGLARLYFAATHRQLPPPHISLAGGGVARERPQGVVQQAARIDGSGGHPGAGQGSRS
jgi:two-component system response regulator FixJ